MNNNNEASSQPKSFKSRVITASIWTTASHFLNQAIRLGGNLIMTRLLAPEYFGLMAIANVFIIGLHMMSDMGLRQSLIQSKRFDEPFINTIWTVQVLRGCIIWLLSLLFALGFYILASIEFWPKDSVYADALLPYVIGVIGFNSVIGGFESTKLTISSRELSLARSVAIGLISQIVALTVMIAWALINKSVWALVVASLVATTVSTILSHLVFTGEKNRFRWNQECFEKIFHFGKWIFITSILGFLISSSDRLLLGGLVDSSKLGLYTIAIYLLGSLKDLIANVIHNVGFPALSEAYRNNPYNIKNVYYKFRIPADIVTSFLTGFIFSTSNLIIGLLYDQRYSDTGWILQILALSIFELRYRLTGECFMAMGKSKLITYLILLNLVVLYLSAYIAFQYYGFRGLVWAVSISSVATIPLNLYFKNKFRLLNWRLELMSLPIVLIGYGLGLLLVHCLE